MLLEQVLVESKEKRGRKMLLIESNDSKYVCSYIASEMLEMCYGYVLTKVYMYMSYMIITPYSINIIKASFFFSAVSLTWFEPFQIKDLKCITLTFH